MKSSEELKRLLESIDRKSYPAYKAAQGAYNFTDYILKIEHVQGDPFAAPSKASVWIDHKRSGYPAGYFDCSHRQTALEDYLVRQFYQAIARFNYKAKGSGKSGLVTTSNPEPEILKRTACECRQDGIIARFEVGFPANGRTINSRELIKILFDFLPDCIRKVFCYKNRRPEEVKAVIDLADDQYFIRQELKKRNLTAFVADGSVLARENGVSSAPMKQSVPFTSPASLKVEIDLPHHGRITGMGVPKGITLIVGGGYHGKSTLLKALETGVYDHIAGDGREYVITEDTAVKLRAEDGRSIRNTDISLFINNLPNQMDTSCFSTGDASGSTSQAASTVEGIEAGSTLFLIDEDSSATNFMLRDDLMQRVIKREQEPITPFIERARDLYEKAGISTIMVAGSSGAYFYIADTILQMEHYKAVDITEHARSCCKEYGIEPAKTAPGFKLPEEGRILSSKQTDKPFQQKRGYPDKREARERIKVKAFGKYSFQVGKEMVDLRFVEQITDSEQTAALAQMLRYCEEHQLLRQFPLKEVVGLLLNEVEKHGLATISGLPYGAVGLALPRKQEIFACLNRYRG